MRTGRQEELAPLFLPSFFYKIFLKDHFNPLVEIFPVFICSVVALRVTICIFEGGDVDHFKKSLLNLLQ